MADTRAKRTTPARPRRTDPASGGIFSRVVERVRQRDWLAVAIEFVMVVAGIFIGLQASLWVEDRADRATERRYLERLLTESDANVRTLEGAIARHEARAATLVALAAALDDRGPAPDSTRLDAVLCRWFVQPAVNVERGTYRELVSSGRLALLRDEPLRSRLALEQASHEASDRLDIIAPLLFEAAAPLSGYREWRIDPGSGAREVTCTFDLAGMRADRRIASVVAQLYRDQATNRVFRERELASVQATRARLQGLLR